MMVSKLSFWPVLLAAALLHFVSAQFGEPAGMRHHIYALSKRSITSKKDDVDGKTFDYVIIGGGQAGLTVASRLTEDPSTNVVVIEAGSSGLSPSDAPLINSPAGNVYTSPGATDMNWNWTTVSQAHVDNKQLPWPRGKVLGGSSSINGLYYIRSTKNHQKIWTDLAGKGAASVWGWDKLFAAMKKSEHFYPPTEEARTVGDIHWQPNDHGTDGPVAVSWPAVSYAPVGAFIDAAGQLSAPPSDASYGGSSGGTFVATSSIDPTNWTRSDARAAYIDPNVGRPNLVILTNYMVSKINFDTSNKTSVKATSVSFQKKKGGKTYQVNASREVILSAGAVNTPQILQVSGVADKGLLNANNVPVVVDLPGVGYNLHDHLAGGVEWSPKNVSDVAPGKLTGDPKVDSFVNSATSYANTSTLMKKSMQSLLDSVRKNQTAAVSAYDAPDAVKQGYNATYGALAQNVLGTDIGIMEILFAMVFEKVQVEAALQSPLSRGSIKIQSADIFDAPLIDPNYFEQSSDLTVLREGFKLARAVGNQAPLKDYLDQEEKPGSSVTSDDQWEQWLRGIIGTEFHPSGTSSMLPEELGGVVDPNLLVYGTQNLRVIDASVPPIPLSCHLMSVTYGVAEIGSEIVKKNKKNYDAKTQGAGAGAGTGGKASGSGKGNSSKGSAKGNSADGTGKGVVSSNSAKTSNGATSNMGRAVVALVLASTLASMSVLLL
ncbi:hypothetical protein MVES_001910 [Malassezia vespertilionis]|uniref:Glucose-methanol-choline oxidoreductase N-terminal domain-containing protein n=2 Tax=Malassezia vespertilionis TaxID=2020962 RepID=A0A2N1JBZ4_9BASI|nr:hypothetical protein MVES_001910 [Malassezia vespertilionis]